ncbi:MAG: tRNA pseudouridine(38-40) synthase TruA [Eubacteriales bacterium]|nr:tRNA pseudouridine(38-40) synthase TruA [Eubacteriales bacterium]
MKQNFKLTIAYDGSRYHGWEAKPDEEMTIQGKLAQVLEKMERMPEGKVKMPVKAPGKTAKTPVKVIGAGRTDAGVHAKGMTANVHLETERSAEEIRDYLNRYLPEDICVREVRQVSERFHSRYHAVGKTYCYTCYVGPLKPVFNRKYVYVLESMPEIEKMRRAAEYLEGTHDFASFCGNPGMKKSTVRTLEAIEISQNGSYLNFTFHGNGFLQHMVRILVGTLLEVGYGRRTPESMAELLAEKKRALAGFTAPAQGLCLMKVDY